VPLGRRERAGFQQHLRGDRRQRIDQRDSEHCREQLGRVEIREISACRASRCIDAVADWAAGKYGDLPPDSFVHGAGALRRHAGSLVPAAGAARSERAQSQGVIRPTAPAVPRLGRGGELGQRGLVLGSGHQDLISLIVHVCLPCRTSRGRRAAPPARTRGRRLHDAATPENQLADLDDDFPLGMAHLDCGEGLGGVVEIQDVLDVRIQLPVGD
jgi:hypothetical protein